MDTPAAGEAVIPGGAGPNVTPSWTSSGHVNRTPGGIVEVRLFKGRAWAVNASSPHGLYDSELASLGMDGSDGTAARG